ncbi:hypothetical protein AB1Y20_012056 [Prymnesium parvum]|uniref:Orotidine 5'-phosphate decarboxylase n=1 Tax=Prymnesium parvum TaxID=97485 RepID=A0AB34IQP4_PRYPA
MALFVAVDTPLLSAASQLAATLHHPPLGLKLGLEFFSASGADGVRAVRASAPSSPLFLDLKLHDIPNTVAGAVRALLPLGAAYLTVHAAGGHAMMQAAVRAAAEAGEGRPRVLAVTVLTSLDEEDLQAVGVRATAEEQVVRLAKLAKAAGVDGVVCSAKEIQPIREALGPEFILMVPGIRPADSEAGDQKRVVTPKVAMEAGASCLVVGRPITQSDDPLKAALAILNEMGVGSGT